MVLLKAGLLPLLLLAASAVSASVGKVVYGYGEAYALDRDGNRRDMAKGAAVNEGDTLVTARGRLHIRFIDGGFVSIYPDSEYRIDRFRFGSGAEDTGGEGATREASRSEAVPVATNTNEKTAGRKGGVRESQEDRGFFTLLKGAARQVTGLLGREFNRNFRFKTAVATIGIRGTGFFAQLCQADCFDAEGNAMQDGLYVKNNTGVITVSTRAGEVSLAQGQSAFAAGSEEVPQQIIQPPVVYNKINPDIELFDFDQNVSIVAKHEAIESADAGQNPQQPPPDIPPVLNLTRAEYIASVDALSTTATEVVDTGLVTDILQVSGDAIEHFESTRADGSVVVFDRNTATLAEKGMDATLGVLWNRWQGNYTYTRNGTRVSTLDDNMHLIASEGFTSSLPGSPRGTVSYYFAGGTSPTIAGVNGKKVGTQNLVALIDYTTNELIAFQLDLSFADASIAADSQTAQFLTATSGNVVLIGGACTGAGCGNNGGFYNGNATINLVGPNAEGIYGSYNMTSGGSGENAVSGSYLATEGPPAF